MRLAKQSQFIPLQNVVYFITSHFLFPKIFTFYINDVILFKCPFPGPKVKSILRRSEVHCKRPFKKILVKGRTGLFQRFLSSKPCEQSTQGNKICSGDPCKARETRSIHNVTYGEGQQANTSKTSTQDEK